MTEYGAVVLILLGPALLICLGFLAWSRNSGLPRLSRVIRNSALFWLVILTLTFHYVVFASANCGGNWLYGYGSCNHMTQAMANASAPVMLISWSIGALYGVLLLIIGGILEWRARHKPSSPAPSSKS